jgi:hypothetical protein
LHQKTQKDDSYTFSMSRPEFESAFLSALPQIKAATVLIGLPPEQLDDRVPGTGTGFFAIKTGLVLTDGRALNSGISEVIPIHYICNLIKLEDRA